MERARAIDHPPSMCYALTEGVCPVTLLSAGAAALAAPAASAIEATQRHGASPWKARGRLWLGLWRPGNGETGAYEGMHCPALEKVGEARFVVHYTGFVPAVCEQLGRPRPAFCWIRCPSRPAGIDRYDMRRTWRHISEFQRISASVSSCPGRRH